MAPTVSLFCGNDIAKSRLIRRTTEDMPKMGAKDRLILQNLSADGRIGKNCTGDVAYLLRVEASDLLSCKRVPFEGSEEIPQVATITTHVVMAAPKDARA